MARPILFTLTLWAAASPVSASLVLTETVVARLEASVRLPPGSAPLAHYARWYTTSRVKSVDDLPFSTIQDVVQIPPGRSLVLGVFALRGGLWGVQPAGAHIVSVKDFPQFVHGGCDAVNVVYDTTGRKVVGTWCNVDDRTLPPPPPRRSPIRNGGR
jgi:hypothetical protein